MDIKKSVIVVGSKSDGKYAIGAKRVFDYVGIPHDSYLASADRTPERVEMIAQRLNSGLYVACIAIAGLSAVLPAAIKAKARTKPVIGVPVAGEGAPLAGADALYSIIQRPPGSPVVAVGINMAENAALFVTELYAQLYPEACFEDALKRYHAEQASKRGYDNEEFPWDEVK